MVLGDDGSKMMFYFYLLNGSAAYVTYALLFAPAVGYVEQVRLTPEHTKHCVSVLGRDGGTRWGLGWGHTVGVGR